MSLATGNFEYGGGRRTRRTPRVRARVERQLHFPADAIRMPVLVHPLLSPCFKSLSEERLERRVRAGRWLVPLLTAQMTFKRGASRNMPAVTRRFV